MQRTGTGDWLSTRMGKLPSEPGSISIVPPQRGRRNDDPTPFCEGPVRAVVEHDQVDFAAAVVGVGRERAQPGLDQVVAGGGLDHRAATASVNSGRHCPAIPARRR